MRLFIILFIILIVFSIYYVRAEGDKSRCEVKRIIALNEMEVKKAEQIGCKLLEDRKADRANLKVFMIYNCDKEKSEAAGLREDFKVRAMDQKINLKIGANKVHDPLIMNNTGKGRVIVVMDTGYDYNHPELSSSYIGGYDYVNRDYDPMDDNGHGTMIAGVITADGKDPRARGVAPDAKVISLKVLDSRGSGLFSNILSGIYLAVDEYHPDAISISIGSDYPLVYKESCDSKFPEINDAIDYAVNNNVAIVIAAGNLGEMGVTLPGCFSNAITVGSTDLFDNYMSYSGKGNAVDILAPGNNVYTTLLSRYEKKYIVPADSIELRAESLPYYYERKSSYTYASGTSLSTPVVAGTIALMKNKDPKVNATELRDRLVMTGNEVSGTALRRVNALEAVKRV